jgi:hypothetical protein
MFKYANLGTVNKNAKITKKFYYKRLPENYVKVLKLF